MSRRLVVNDVRNTLGEITMWDRLCEWFGAEFVGGDYATLAEGAAIAVSCCKLEGDPASLIVRNCTWFPPIKTNVPTISLLQDISPDGETRKMQEEVIRSSSIVVFNSAFTHSKYSPADAQARIIPLPVDFSLFTPQNAMGCQQALGLPDGCVCWIGASQGAAGHVKGWDVMLQIARLNPDLHFVCVFKDTIPPSFPPNMRCYARLPQDELVRVIGACRVGLCTSRMESQHLAGIEMGACGLPLVVPPVGVYCGRIDAPLILCEPKDFTDGIRGALAHGYAPNFVRDYWQREFNIPVVRAAWEKLVEEVEDANPGR